MSLYRWPVEIIQIVVSRKVKFPLATELLGGRKGKKKLVDSSICLPENLCVYITFSINDAFTDVKNARMHHNLITDVDF